MSDFLSLIESFNGSQASTDTLYSGEGGRRVKRFGDRHPKAFSEALGLIERVMEGDRYAALHFQEAMSTSDFPLLFGDALDRALAASFQEFPSGIEAVTRTRRVRDFRSVKTFAVDGAEGQLDAVGERAAYPETPLSETFDEWSVAKFGRILDFSWEQWINDDLDAFRNAPARLGRAARRTRQRFITGLYVDASGPHASLYTSGNANIITGNPVLSIAGLETAFTVLGNMRDEDGEPISVDAVTLVVPPALRVTAQNIIEGTILDLNEAGGTANQRLRAPNWMRNAMNLVVDPYIPVVASSNGATSWFLFADPSSGRAALETGPLIGHEEPELWVKTSNAERVGGGTVGPDSGDFEHDSIRYRVRDVFGGARLLNTHGYKATVASNGSGS